MMEDRLNVLARVLEQDGFAPETLRALELVLEELRYLRDEKSLFKSALDDFAKRVRA